MIFTGFHKTTMVNAVTTKDSYMKISKFNRLGLKFFLRYIFLRMNLQHRFCTVRHCNLRIRSGHQMCLDVARASEVMLVTSWLSLQCHPIENQICLLVWRSNMWPEMASCESTVDATTLGVGFSVASCQDQHTLKAFLKNHISTAHATLFHS